MKLRLSSLSEVYKRNMKLRLSSLLEVYKTNTKRRLLYTALVLFLVLVYSAQAVVLLTLIPLRIKTDIQPVILSLALLVLVSLKHVTGINIFQTVKTIKTTF